MFVLPKINKTTRRHLTATRRVISANEVLKLAPVPYNLVSLEL